MNDDGLDGIVIGKLLELGDDLLGRKNYAIQLNHGDLGAEAGKRFFLRTAKTQIDQRKHGHREQHKQSTAHQQPNPNPRMPFSHNETSVAPGASGLWDNELISLQVLRIELNVVWKYRS